MPKSIRDYEIRAIKTGKTRGRPSREERALTAFVSHLIAAGNKMEEYCLDSASIKEWNAAKKEEGHGT